MTFKVGDHVTLSAGGPVMNITALGNDAQGRSEVTCQWFNKNNNLQTADFPPEALRLYTGEKGSTESIDDDDGDWMTR